VQAPEQTACLGCRRQTIRASGFRFRVFRILCNEFVQSRDGHRPSVRISGPIQRYWFSFAKIAPRQPATFREVTFEWGNGLYGNSYFSRWSNCLEKTIGSPGTVIGDEVKAIAPMESDLRTPANCRGRISGLGR